MRANVTDSLKSWAMALLSAMVVALLPMQRVVAQNYSSYDYTQPDAAEYDTEDQFSTSALETQVAKLEATNKAMQQSVAQARSTTTSSSGSGSVAQINYQVDDSQSTPYSPTGADSGVANDVAQLRAQLDAQRFEMASMQSQIKLRDVELNHAAPRLFVTYENLLLQPLQSNSTGLIVETPTGYSNVQFPWQMEYSPRVQFGRSSGGDDFGWRMRYWHFHHHQAFTANNANGLIPTGNEGTVGYLSEDGDITTGLAFITSGQFHSNVRTDVIDLEMQRNIAAPLNLYGGIRYGKLAQNYTAVTDQGRADAYSEFRGVGPTVALAFQHQLPLNRLWAFANARGSMLFGHKEFGVKDSVNSMTQQVGIIDLRSFDDGANTLVTNAELQVGMRFTGEWYSLMVAMEAQHYGNVGGPNPPAVFTGPDGGLSGGNPINDSLGFAGLSVGTELYW